MHRRRRSLSALAPLVALTAALALAPTTAPAADDFQPTRSAELVERSHTVDLVMDADRATLTIRRTVHNGGQRHDQATFWIEVPESAVATGLRTLATVKGRPVWYEGELMEAEAAAAKYKELTGIGGYYPKDPALLSWRHQGMLALQVFPCPPGEDKSVEYTLTLPVEYVHGRSVLKLPRLGTEAIAADVRVRPASRRDQIFLGDAPVPPGTRVRWPKAAGEDEVVVVDEGVDDGESVDFDERLLVGEDEVLVSLARRDPARLIGRVASVAIRGDRHLREFEVEAAPKLSQAPRGAHVVVLVDTSRSLSDEEVAAEIAAARSAIAGFPDARVEVVPFDRAAAPLFGRFLGRDAALAALGGLQPARHNGSDVDLALATAGELLQRAPRGAPRRVLLLTDALTRESLTPARLRGALATTGALVHVGIPSLSGGSELVRDDAHAWSPAVKGTGGLVWGAAIDGEESEGRRRAVFEEWVRPLRIDHLKVVIPGLGEGDFEVPESLDEGEGLRDLRLHAAALPWVRVEGELWTKPLREVFTRDQAHGRLWSALVFGSELLGELTEEEMMPLALFGGAVSPVTSYLAIEPGVRPSTEGLFEGEGLGLGSLGLIGRGAGAGGHGYGARRFDHQAWLRGELARLRGACGAPALRLTLETTRDEVVAVAAQLSGASDPVSARCVEEGVWAWDLPASFADVWKRYVVSA
ncbi:MAG: VWA domain-containing protein [Myxococcales bacterium]|nr:VWA domain-containing protein [Myxococcales bacterium]